MTIGNVKFKAASNAPSTQMVQDLEQQLRDALQKIKDAESNYGLSMTSEEKTKMALEAADLGEKLANLEYYLKTGEWFDSSSTTSTASGPLLNTTDLAQGWYVYNPSTGETVAAKIVDGVIEVENSSLRDANGNAIPTNLWFVGGNSTDPATKVVSSVGKTVGKDVIYTITYEDGHEEEILIKDAAECGYLQIGMNFLASSDSVLVDNRNVSMVDPMTGKKGSTYTIGSKFDDILYGGDGNDTIEGIGGDDFIDGGIGSDNISGDASASLKQIYSEAALGEEGDDTIFDTNGMDMATSDAIDGNGGIDTVYRGETYDNVIGTTHVEHDNEFIAANNASEIESWFSKSEGWNISYSNGEMVLTAKDGSTESVIDMLTEAGYMVDAVQTNSGKDIVLNIVKAGEAGEDPVHYRVRIKDLKGELNITGGFIDLSGIDTGATAVHLTGTGNEGDIILAPKTIFDGSGMSVDDLGNANMSDSKIETALAYYQNELEKESVWHDATYKNGVITIDGSGLSDLNIPSELGAEAYVVTKEDGSLEITVSSNVSGESTRMVIVVENPGKGLADNISINGATLGVVYNLGKVGDDGKPNAGVTIDGLEGEDFLVGYEFGTSFNDKSGDTGTKLNTPIAIDHAPTAPETKTAEEKLLESINTATWETIENLEKYREQVEALTDEDVKTELLDAIEKQREELIRGELDSEDLEAEDLAKVKAQIDLLSDEDVQAELEDEYTVKKEEIEKAQTA